MVQELRPGLFRIKVPLPESPLKFLNSYVIKGERNLVIDTGLNRPECRQALTGGLDELGVDLNESDFFITHLHADHFALMPEIITPSSRVYFNRPEAEVLEAGTDWQLLLEYGLLNGFPEEEQQKAFKNHPARRFGTKWIPELNVIEDGQALTVGDYNFTCLSTPGHTLGHTCLWEADKKILISGDHVLGDITPNIVCWWEGRDPLGEYLASLERVLVLGAELVLPGHRSLIHDLPGRIAQLKEHHKQRLREIQGILPGQNLNAYDIASRMSWDIKCDSWQEFPPAQKWFATGEALAHLRHLELRGQAARSMPQGIYLYTTP